MRGLGRLECQSTNLANSSPPSSTPRSLPLPHCDRVMIARIWLLSQWQWCLLAFPCFSLVFLVFSLHSQRLVPIMASLTQTDFPDFFVNVKVATINNKIVKLSPFKVRASLGRAPSWSRWRSSTRAASPPKTSSSTGPSSTATPSKWVRIGNCS